MFMPVVVMCLVAEPQNCAVFRGNILEDEESCVVEMYTQGLPNLTNQCQEAYIAGLTCLEVDILDQAAELE